jgi:hypothetical protein
MLAKDSRGLAIGLDQVGRGILTKIRKQFLPDKQAWLVGRSLMSMLLEETALRSGGFFARDILRMSALWIRNVG